MIWIINFIFQRCLRLQTSWILRKMVLKMELKNILIFQGISQSSPVIPGSPDILNKPFFFPSTLSEFLFPEYFHILGGFILAFFPMSTFNKLILKINLEQSLCLGWWAFTKPSWCPLPQQNFRPLLARNARDLARSALALCLSAASSSFPSWTLACHSFSSRSGPYQQVSIVPSTPGTPSPA